MTHEQDAVIGNAGAGQGAAPDAGADAGDGFQGGSLLTRSDAGKEAAEEQGKDAVKDDPADEVPDQPEGYALKFAQGAKVDQELLGNFTKAAHALGLKPSQAQKLASLYEAHAAKAGERAREAQRQTLETARAKWEREIETSPGFAQERDHARAALRQYGDKELYALLDQTNLGSHPKMWAFMAKIGKALAEPGFRGDSVGRAQKTAADILYPNQGKE